MDKDAVIRSAYENGFNYEGRYHGCAQCTIAAVQDALGIRNDYIFKAAGGLAGGCGLLRDGPCGGYTGGIMVMSMFFARRRRLFDNDREDSKSSYRMAVEHHKRFIEEYGSIICMDIHKKLFGRSFDLWNPDEYKLFDEAGAHTDKCTSLVGKAASWAAEILIDEIEKRGIDLEEFEHLRFVCG
ncbi:MAG TPA: C-GCAxxG-C-C family protein [Spirochaetota bacterium]|nr:C-GCAxxG-C-C family protein [Spirochaetota bacterium]